MTALWALANHPGALSLAGIIGGGISIGLTVAGQWRLGLIVGAPSAVAIIAGIVILRALKI
jgi:hypothetical protein